LGFGILLDDVTQQPFESLVSDSSDLYIAQKNKGFALALSRLHDGDRWEAWAW
jgi:hypothetical protein